MLEQLVIEYHFFKETHKTEYVLSVFISVHVQEYRTSDAIHVIIRKNTVSFVSNPHMFHVIEMIGISKSSRPTVGIDEIDGS